MAVIKTSWRIKEGKSSHHPLCAFLSVCLSVCRSVSLSGYMYDVYTFCADRWVSVCVCWDVCRYKLVWAHVEGSSLVLMPHCFVDTLTSTVE